MEISCNNLSLHPEAEKLLFKHYRVLRNIFSDVLGHLEVDYASIALINTQNQVLFFSSKPSAEINLIHKQLWKNDPFIQDEFYFSNKTRKWHELDWKSPCDYSLYKIKQPGFSFGLSIPSSYEKYKVTYSFALKTKNQELHEELVERLEVLLSIGQYCLKKILSNIPLNEIKQSEAKAKPLLKLIINNEVTHA